MRLYSFPMKDAVNQQIDTYINSFAQVMNFCHQTEQLILPVPQTLPAWFAEAEQTTSLAKTNALLWKNSIGENLLHMPEALLAYQPVYQSKAQTVHNLLQILADHPEDQNSRALAAQHLSDLRTVLLSQENAIQSQTNRITDFEQKMNTDIAKLKEISQKAAKESEVDQNKIKELKTAIEDANALVSNFDNWITVGEVAIGTGMAIVGLGLAFSPVSVPAIVVGVVVSVVGGLEVIALEIAKSVYINRIRDLNNELTGMEAVVKSFVDLEYKINAITNCSTKMQQAFQNINGTWDTIGAFANDMLQMIQQEQQVLERETLLKAVHTTASANQAADSYYDLLKQIRPLNFNFSNYTQVIA